MLTILEDIKPNNAEITILEIGLMVLKSECCGNHSLFQLKHKISLNELDVMNG